MNTEIKMFITACVLGIIGFTNSSAVSDNKKEMIPVNSEILSPDIEMNLESLSYSAQAYSAMDIESEIEEYVTIVNLPGDNILTDDAVIYRPHYFSDIDFENEIQSRQLAGF